MKNIFTIVLLSVITTLNAQVIIGDASGTAPTKTSVLLEFAAGQNKGIIVPYVRTLPTAAALVGGAIILDATTPTAARMKVYNGTSWTDLSGQDGDVTSALTIQPPTSVVETGAKAIIGDRTSAADGVLVLESSSKAMVLPTVADVQNIPSPSPGMMVYVNKSGAKRLAVYNGSKWSFWKEPVGMVPTVTSATGRIWMDRNLGATQVATSATDAAAYGDLYQWGRLTDGHEKRNSAPTAILSNTDAPGNGNFITTNTTPNDWRSPQNDNLWQRVNGINNPCPSGFRLPTATELNAEMALFSSQNAAGAFNSPLKMPSSDYRTPGGALSGGSIGFYWTSTTSIPYSYVRSVTGTAGYIQRGYGFSVRCIKDY